MVFSFMRVDGRLHWYLQKKYIGVSYPVFACGSLQFLFRLIFHRSRRSDFAGTVADFEHAKSLKGWYDSLPPDPTKPFHDILDS